MAIRFSSQIEDFQLADPEKIKKWISTIIQADEKRVGNISYLFCDDDYLLKANIQFLNHDTLTDIITFDYVEGNVIAGDIMISVDRVKENAQIFGVSFEHELHRVVIHGILHLLGQGDKTEPEAKQMRQKEESALLVWATL